MLPSDSSSIHWEPVRAPAPITLSGEYVTLEPLDAERHTASLWEAVRGHDELWKWLADGPYANDNALRQALAQKQLGTAAVFLAIVPKATGACAGYASYMRMEPAHGVVEVGNILMTPGLQRTRAATEAMFLMASHVFDTLEYRRYEWKCNADNEPSRRAALRYGFSFEGIFRQHMVVKDKNRNTAWYSMLDREWPARRRAFETWLAPENFDAEGRQKRSLEAVVSAGR